MIFGVIPPLNVLNEILRTGGNNGGMGPGTTWEPFVVTELEYDELVSFLLAIDLSNAREAHPYIAFKKVIFDNKLSKKDLEVPTDEQLLETGLKVAMEDKDLSRLKTLLYWQAVVANRFRPNLIVSDIDESSL